MRMRSKCKFVLKHPLCFIRQKPYVFQLKEKFLSRRDFLIFKRNKKLKVQWKRGCILGYEARIQHMAKKHTHTHTKLNL